MAQWVGMEALENENHASVASNQPQVGWSCTNMRSVRDFFLVSCRPIEPLGGLFSTLPYKP